MKKSGILFAGKKLVLLLICINFAFASELKFKDVTLDEFSLNGISKKITYKTKEQRNALIAKLWEEFFNSKAFAMAKGDDKLMVIYSNYKQSSFNSFDCFIGVKSTVLIAGMVQKTLSKRNFNKTTLVYKPNLDLNKLWDEINGIRIKRDFKMDMEEYVIGDLMKPSYNFNIYLSKK